MSTSELLNKLIEIELASAAADPTDIRRLAIEAQGLLLGIQLGAVNRLNNGSHSTRGEAAGAAPSQESIRGAA